MSIAGSAVRVGLLVIVALIILTSMIAFFDATNVFSHKYALHVLFDDASGILKDAPVELAGVHIGDVRAINLTPQQKADIELRIDQDQHIPVGSKFFINEPILGGSGVVDVVPPLVTSAQVPVQMIQPDTPNLVGAQAGNLNASLTSADALIKELTNTTQAAQDLLYDPRLRQTIANLNKASQNGVQISSRLNDAIAADNTAGVQLLRDDNREAMGLLEKDNLQIESLLADTSAGSHRAIGNLDASSEELHGLVTGNRDQLNEMIANLRDTSASVAGITDQVNDMFKDGDLGKNLSATMLNMKEASDKLNLMAGNLQGITGDTAVQGNLRQTLLNVRDTTEETHTLVARLNSLIGPRRHGDAVVVVPAVRGESPTVIAPITVPSIIKMSTPATPQSNVQPSSITGGSSRASVLYLSPRVGTFYNNRSREFRADIDTLVPFNGSSGSFGRIGMYGVGDTNRLILELGQFSGASQLIDIRGGLYAGKISMGTDLGLGGPESLSIDAYDPNRLQIDGQAELMLSRQIGLTLGMDDITRRDGAVVGLEYLGSH